MIKLLGKSKIKGNICYVNATEQRPIKTHNTMILRSQFSQIEADPTVLHIPSRSKFFYSEQDTLNYQKSLGNKTTKIDQWQLQLDNMSEQEIAERSAYIETKIAEREAEQIAQYGKVLMNDAQRQLLRDGYGNSVDIWSVSIVSDETPEEFYKEGSEMTFLYDDEINGATPVRYGEDGVRLLETFPDAE